MYRAHASGEVRGVVKVTRPTVWSATPREDGSSKDFSYITRRAQYSRIWYLAVWYKFTNVSEHHAASILRVKAKM
jgi:hypothetical protein